MFSIYFFPLTHFSLKSKRLRYILRKFVFFTSVFAIFGAFAEALEEKALKLKFAFSFSFSCSVFFSFYNFNASLLS